MFYNQYTYSLHEKISVSFEINFINSEVNSFLLTHNQPAGYERNIATGDWGLTSEYGVKILDLKTARQTYITGNITPNYKINFNKSILSIGTGFSISYINNTYITRWEIGTFEGEATGTHNLQLVYPYYTRIIDPGININIDYTYELSEKINLGGRIGSNHFFKSGYRFYYIGINTGFKF